MPLPNTTKPCASIRKFALAYYNRGFTYYKLRKYELTVADQTQAIHYKPEFWSAYKNRGNAYHALKQYDKAVADCSEVLRLKPDDADSFYNRANAHDELKQNRQGDCGLHRRDSGQAGFRQRLLQPWGDLHRA